jgi:hypothetical protein
MHRSLAGPRRAPLGFLKQAIAELKTIEGSLEGAPAARAILHEFAAFVRKDASLLILPSRVLAARPRAWWKKLTVLRKIKRSTRSRVVSAPVRETISEYFSLLCRGLELRLFERLFALWHAIHVPLSAILFISAAIHVVAVHLY